MRTLKERYEQMVVDRTPYLDRARDCARLSIPTLFPPDGATKSTNYPTPWQSLGARCVNNLAAKLLLALFPPNAPFFKYVIDDFQLQRMAQQDGMRAKVEEGLNKVERAVQTEIEAVAMRPKLFESAKNIIVGGNALLTVNPQNKLRLFKLDSYVVKRDPVGNPIEALTFERISKMELPVAAIPLLSSTPALADKDKDTVDLYTVFQREDKRWVTWQEIYGQMIPGTRGHTPLDKPPFLALRWTALDGEDYGRGMFEEYLGDFKSLEGLQKAIVTGSVAAAKVLFLVRPNSTTSKDAISKSESGDVKTGHKDDVSVLQMEKYNDFRVAQETRANLIQSLSMAFLLNSAVQRQGERVTAEEIRFMAQELEQGLGGVYSTLSQDLQLPLANIVISNMERTGRLPALPKEAVKPVVATGLEAIGRGNDLNKYDALIRQLTPIWAEVSPYINKGDLVKRIGTGNQIDMSGLVRSEEEVQKERQQAQMMALAERAAPNVVNQVGGALNQQ